MSLYESELSQQYLSLIKETICKDTLFTIETNEDNIEGYDADTIPYHILLNGEYFALIELRPDDDVEELRHLFMSIFTHEGVELYWRRFPTTSLARSREIMTNKFLPVMTETREYRIHNAYNMKIQKYKENVAKLKEVVPHITGDDHTFLTLLHAHFLYAEGEGYEKAKKSFESKANS